MSQAKRIILFAGVICLAMTCTNIGPVSSNSDPDDDHGGSGTDVSGIVYGPHGTQRAQNASVVLRSSCFLSRMFSLGKRSFVDSAFACSTRTDDTGFYKFDSIREGSYCIEAADSSGNRLLRDFISAVEGIDILHFVDTLKPPATIMGTIQPFGDSMTGAVFVYGLDNYAVIEPNGGFVLEYLPEGKLRLNIIVKYNGTSRNDTLSVTTRSADTVHLTLPGDTGSGDIGKIYFGEARSVHQTSDGGYIITGGICVSFPFAWDAYLIKMTAEGDTMWTRTYSRGVFSCGNTVRQTIDGGYIIAGANARDRASNAERVYLIKTTAAGDTMWTKTYADGSYGGSVRQTTDGGYIIAGDMLGPPMRFYLIKTTSSGDTVWTKTYGGIYDEDAQSVQQTFDGGYIIVGMIDSLDRTDLNSLAGGKVYLIKTTSTGDTIWTRKYGNGLAGCGYQVQQTTDSGYIIAGTNDSEGCEKVYLIKTTATGDTVWTKMYGGCRGACGYSVQQTADNGYIITGSTGTDPSDVFLLKTTAAGDVMWTKTYGGPGVDYGNSVKTTIDGGYIIAGSTSSPGSQEHQFYLIKTTSAGDTVWTKTF